MCLSGWVCPCPRYSPTTTPPRSDKLADLCYDIYPTLPRLGKLCLDLIVYIISFYDYDFHPISNPNQSTARPTLTIPSEESDVSLHQQKKRSTGLIHPNLSEALNLAVIYNQRRSNAMHERRSYIRRRLRSNDASFTQLGISSERDVGSYDGDELPFWDAYDVVNQLYVELGK